jgi:signal transduction histidine kinase
VNKIFPDGALPTLLSNEHRITEKGMMEFQPFGVEPDGTPIRDLSGIVIRAHVDYLEDYVSRTRGEEAGRLAVKELVQRLNERVPDSAYRVTAEFLRKPWNSYSAEFGSFSAEFCIAISGDELHQFNMARTKAISPIIVALGRPFSVAQIYKMSAYFAQRYSKDSFFTEAIEVSKQAAIIQMRLSERTYRQLDPYRWRCAEHWCNGHKGYFVGVPQMFHGLPGATVTDRHCIAKGDDYCEWEIAWSDREGAVSPLPGISALHSQGEEENHFQESDPQVLAARRQRHAADLRPFPIYSDPILLSREHPITEKGLMEFQPFGIGSDGIGIRDVRGTTIVACVEYLEGYVRRTQDPARAKHAVEELARQLNKRIPDRAYHVTPEFLRKPWNSYSFEFTAFLGQLCAEISHDPQFAFNMARERAISPFVQVLGRPFSVPRIYKMSPYFAQIYFGKDMYSIEVVSVSDRSAILRMRLGERALQHFGRYLKACAIHWCDAHKGYYVAVPENFHQLPAARVTDRACIAKGDPYCEWGVTWSQKERTTRRPIAVSVARWILRNEIEERERLIDQQVHTLDARHVELQEAYVQQQQITAELQRRVDQLTTLHETGLLLTSILNREMLIEKVLETLTGKLRYDRGTISFFDRARQVAYDTRIAGVSEEAASFARTLEVPVTDPHSVEGTVLLRGEPILVGDVREVWERMHPLNQQRALLADAKSFISVPLKVKNEILGCLTVDRTKAHALTKDDLNLMGTMASQVAIALDTTNAYSQIEALNIGLEAKVQDRTQELQAANEKLRELDRLKSSFVSMVSHELRTPMTSIKGYVDNLLDGVAGPLNEKPAYYLKRVKHNVERLTRMINDLLDLSRIEAGAVQLQLGFVSIPELLNDVVEGFQTNATERSVSVKAHSMSGLPLIQGDRDKLYQILNNLIQNAIKFTPKGGSIWAEAQAGPPGYVQICVSDTGCGIAPEERGKVFERFYRGESVAIEDRGAGLGLAITKNLVELHHGRIWVESIPGEGSRFFFTVPISQASVSSGAS